jgi:hypothetical protein
MATSSRSQWGTRYCSNVSETKLKLGFAISGISCQQLRQNQYTSSWRIWRSIEFEQQGQFVMIFILSYTKIEKANVLLFSEAVASELKLMNEF